ncbi:MAG: hypothetical protein ABFC67_04085 [Mizugakiibacter sp.]|uniref:hypothetical protein n=1 Tax=Mizugakiibacter sp. TaxID=1972610 RepID=UPI0031C31E94|nr:hypothetical protein [Xanthomonadaceae bacterium]
MSAPAPVWPRPQWSVSGQEAVVLWFVFGDFDAELPVDGAAYRTRGVPDGVEFARYRNADLAAWAGYPLAGSLGRLLGEEEPALLARAAHAQECLVLRGTLPDPADLDYLHDCVGLIAALNDLGGIAVVDPQMLSIFDAETWRRRYFADAAFTVREHVLILCSEDAEHAGRLHVHTRGMRKFARPDLSIRNVPAAAAGAAGQLAERFAQFQALGGRIADGHEVALDDTLAMRARRAGDLDDPAFNNLHVALVWPL